MRTAPLVKRKIQGRKRGSGSCLFKNTLPGGIRVKRMDSACRMRARRNGGGIRKMIEVEIKIPVGDLEEVREGLQRKGFAYERSLIEKDTYFDGGINGIRKSGEALRVRQIIHCDTGEKISEIDQFQRKKDGFGLDVPTGV